MGQGIPIKACAASYLTGHVVPGHFSTPLGRSCPGPNGNVLNASSINANVTSFVIMQLKTLRILPSLPWLTRLQNPHAWSEVALSAGSHSLRTDFGSGRFQVSAAAAAGERRLRKKRAPEMGLMPRVV